MHNKFTLPLVLFLAFATTHVAAQEPAQQDAQRGSTKRNADHEKPEFVRRSLPADTFKPSEEVSEDTAVPFPVDI